MLQSLSPKALVAFAIPLVAALLLWLLTGDSSYLLGILLALVTGGGAVMVPPAKGVAQEDLLAVKRGHAQIIPTEKLPPHLRE